MASRGDSTQLQYRTYLNRWFEYCNNVSVDPYTASVNTALNFLSNLYTNGLSYSAINTARSALSSVLDVTDGATPFGQLPLVKRFMKGVFQLRPALPRYNSIWDVKTVFDYFRSQPPIADLTLKELSSRLAFLLSLCSGQRCQTIRSLRIDCMQVTDNSYTFHINTKQKQTRPGFHLRPIIFKRYPAEPALCAYEHIKIYLILRNAHSELLISYVRPYSPVSTDTISRWCRSVLKNSGIDTTQFTAHSTRAASCSFLVDHQTSLNDVLKSAGWTSEQTFQRYYNLPSDN